MRAEALALLTIENRSKMSFGALSKSPPDIGNLSPLGLAISVFSSKYFAIYISFK
jgi:hypothetical protein